MTEEPKTEAGKIRAAMAAELELNEGQRRRRVSTDDSKNMVGLRRLGVDLNNLDTENYEYRHVNVREGRLQRFLKKDWDVVEDPNGDISGRGGISEIVNHAGNEKDSGQPFEAVLLQKPKDLFNEDRAATQEAESEKMRQTLSGHGPVQIDESYIPNGGRDALKPG